MQLLKPTFSPQALSSSRLVHATQLERSAQAPRRDGGQTPQMAPVLERALLAGRLAELSSGAHGAMLTVALSLVARTQREGEPVVWVTTRDSVFYPHDAQASGVLLDALPIVRVAQGRELLPTADPLLRSGAFGLVIVDLAASVGPVSVPAPLLGRLQGLAQRHDAALLCLTRKSSESASLSSLVSWRGEATWTRKGDVLQTEIMTLKDKRQGPGERILGSCRGAIGMR